MKKTIYLKTIFLLCTLLAGVVSAHAEVYAYEWERITDLSKIVDSDVVLLVDETNGLAMSRNGEFVLGYKIAVSDGKISLPENVTASMMWTIGRPNPYNDELFTFTNNGDDLKGSYSTQYVRVGTSMGQLSTNEFMMDGYGANGGKLYYLWEFDPGLYNQYFIWSFSADPPTINIDTQTNVRFTLYKRGEVKNYAKWKRVGVGEGYIPVKNDDVIVIVDQATERALANDKADKDPDAVAVTLNDDKDRIAMDEVPEQLQWIFFSYADSYDEGIIKAQFRTSEGKYLYAVTGDGGPVLRVGASRSGYRFENSDNINFSLYFFASYYFHEYGFRVDESIFRNTWQLHRTEADNLFLYKKIVDSQKYVKIEMPEYYNVDKSESTSLTITPTITGAEASFVKWKSSDENVATVNSSGVVTLKKRGSVVITAYVEETEYHDKASAECTVIIDDRKSTAPGSRLDPFTVAEAITLARTQSVTVARGQTVELEKGVYYYVKGKVSKVNSGMMAMFGDIDFSAMKKNMPDGGEGMDNFEKELDDMDFDSEDMEESGFEMPDFSGMGFDKSAFFGPSDKMSYYISDDGTKKDQMKVVNGHGTRYNNIDLSPGDWVIVCGPLVYNEETNIFSSMIDYNNDERPFSAKVDEPNYLDYFEPALIIKNTVPKEVYVNRSLNCKDLYELDKNHWNRWVSGNSPSTGEVGNFPDGNTESGIKATVQSATFNSSDEDIAKWDKNKGIIVGVNEGQAKITVKVKVDYSYGRSYTMKRKFKVIVKTRDLELAGYNEGDWELTTSTDDLNDGTRIVLAGTRVKEGKEPTDYLMVENNAMMGGGKNGSKIEFTESTIPGETVVSKNGLQVVLEKADDTSWYLNVGTDENGRPLYLYASDTSSEEQGGNGLDYKKIMEMFNSDTGLKVTTKEDMGAEHLDNLKATISFGENGIATISFGENNTIMLGCPFDMGEMTEMFVSLSENGNQDENTKKNPDMGDFDLFMAAFNSLNAEEGKEPKWFMPRIYRFVPDGSYDITIGDTEWRTIIPYKDVAVPEGVDAYIVTKVTPEEEQSMATLKKVEQLAGGEPYLLHSTSGNHNLTLLTPTAPDELAAPTDNKLERSDRKTEGTAESTSVYVLANKSLGVGFYRWVGDELGANRVYLPVEGSGDGAREYCGFLVETTAIEAIDDIKTNVGPFYDLQGRRVNHPTKGVYLVNDKKVIVK